MSTTIESKDPVSIMFDWILPPHMDARRILDWLRVLEVEMPTPEQLRDVSLGQQYSILGAALVREMLLAGHMPNFVPPAIVSVAFAEGADSKIRIAVTLDVLDGVPPSFYLRTLKYCFESLSLLSRIEINSANRAYVFDKLLKEVVNPLRRVIPSGQSTMHLLRCAHARGIPFIHRGLGIFQLGWGSRARLVDRSTTDADSAIGSRLSHDKASAAALLKLAGLPHPEHVVLGSELGLIAASKQLSFPLVVKPSDRDCGIGVSVDINDLESLEAAFKLAKEKSASGRIIVERQVSGVCHRLFIAHGRLLYAVKRDPITIWGDGVRSIAQIIAAGAAVQAARPPWSRVLVPSLDDDVIKRLNAQGLTPDSVLADGVAVVLRRIESTAWGGSDEEVTQRVHPENVSVALRAAELFKLSVVGVDMITTDISVPWHQNGAIINELNFAPLLGGAEISRSYIPQYLTHLIDGDGKIPIEAHGSQADCLNRRQYWQALGQRCFIVTSTDVLDDGLLPVVMPTGTLKDKVRALLLRADVDVILVCTEKR